MKKTTRVITYLLVFTIVFNVLFVDSYKVKASDDLTARAEQSSIIVGIMMLMGLKVAADTTVTALTNYTIDKMLQAGHTLVRGADGLYHITSDLVNDIKSSIADFKASQVVNVPIPKEGSTSTYSALNVRYSINMPSGTTAYIQPRKSWVGTSTKLPVNLGQSFQIEIKGTQTGYKTLNFYTGTGAFSNYFSEANADDNIYPTTLIFTNSSYTTTFPYAVPQDLTSDYTDQKVEAIPLDAVITPNLQDGKVPTATSTSTASDYVTVIPNDVPGEGDIPGEGDGTGSTTLLGKILDLVKGFFDFVKTIPSLILEGLKALLIALFVPSDSFFNNNFHEFKDIIAGKYPDSNLNQLNDLGDLAAVEFTDRYIDIMGVHAKIIDAKYVNEFRPTLQNWTSGFFGFLLILFNFSMIYFLIRGTRPFVTSSTTTVNGVEQ